jgi:hypothetical protein
MKKISIMGLALVLALSLLSVPVFADSTMD